MNQCVICHRQEQPMPMVFQFFLSMFEEGTISVEIHGQTFCTDCARAICISSIAGVSLFNPYCYDIIRDKLFDPFIKKVKDNGIKEKHSEQAIKLITKIVKEKCSAPFVKKMKDN